MTRNLDPRGVEAVARVIAGERADEDYKGPDVQLPPLDDGSEMPWPKVWTLYEPMACAAITAYLEATPSPATGEVAEMVRERDEARSETALYAKTLSKLRSTLMNIQNDIEDEGDRRYFGSTNDADELVEIARKIEDLEWSKILEASQPPVDLYAMLDDLRARLTATEARAERLRLALEDMASGPIREAEERGAHELANHIRGLVRRADPDGRADAASSLDYWQRIGHGPTPMEQMAIAGKDAVGHYKGDLNRDRWIVAGEVYDAVLAAAPTPAGRLALSDTAGEE